MWLLPCRRLAQGRACFFENEIPCAKEPLQKRCGMNHEIRALPEADQMARGGLPLTIEGAR